MAGSFNLAVGAEVGLGGILVAALISKLGLEPAQAVAFTLLAGAATGLISGLIITRAKIDSFIATLGMSSVLLAGIAWISGSQQILNLGAEFRSLAVTQVLGVTLPVYIVFIVALITWYILEQTPVGRRMYATGFNPAGARLAGVNTNRLIVGSLMAGGVLAALAGVILSSRINAGDPTVGPSVLLPALTAVFLGSTQFKRWPLQRMGNGTCRIRPRYRHQGTPTSRSSHLDYGTLQRPGSFACSGPVEI